MKNNSAETKATPSQASQQKIISVVRCENCNIRIKAKDKKWCQRCIDIYYRQQLPIEDKEQSILNEVGERYMNARIFDLPEHIQQESAVNIQDLFFYGGIGRGKTYAMAAILRHYVYCGYDCRRITFDTFCVQLRSTFAASSTQSEWDAIKPLIECDILFIDDLGLKSKEETEFAYVTLYTILNNRQEKMLPTVISSNRGIEALKNKFDSRIASRLNTATPIEFTGEDRRRNG